MKKKKNTRRTQEEHKKNTGRTQEEVALPLVIGGSGKHQVHAVYFKFRLNLIGVTPLFPHASIPDIEIKSVSF